MTEEEQISSLASRVGAAHRDTLAAIQQATLHGGSSAAHLDLNATHRSTLAGLSALLHPSGYGARPDLANAEVLTAGFETACLAARETAEHVVARARTQQHEITWGARRIEAERQQFVPGDGNRSPADLAADLLNALEGKHVKLRLAGRGLEATHADRMTAVERAALARLAPAVRGVLAALDAEQGWMAVDLAGDAS